MGPQTRKVVWILINCGSLKEANVIGSTLLKKRLCSCFDIFRREKTAYFWPPRKGTVESGKGALLILETLSSVRGAAIKEVVRLHKDTLPFIGYIAMDVLPAYYIWVKNELKNHV